MTRPRRHPAPDPNEPPPVVVEPDPGRFRAGHRGNAARVHGSHTVAPEDTRPRCRHRVWEGLRPVTCDEPVTAGACPRHDTDTGSGS